MKRLLGSIVTGIALLLAVPVSHVGAQSLNNFTISSYDIQYELSKDSENRSVLKTTETITAQFPSSDQNHGIERAIPSSYDGHPVSLNMDSITNTKGEALQYSTYSSNGATVYRIGDPDIYVHGEQIYKLTYMQRDVTRFYQDTNKDEWYWDTNGTEWRVPIEQLTIGVKIDSAIVSALEGQSSCYIGAAGSSNTCSVVARAEGEYTVSAQNLQRGENITVAYGFKPNTFAQYQPSLFEILRGIWAIVSVVTFAVGFIILTALSVSYFRRSGRRKELHTVPAEYIPPRNASVTASGQVTTPYGPVFTAQLLDFAVRHIIAIIETKPSGRWTIGEYDIEIKSDPSQLLEEEKELLSDMFGALPKVGDRLALESLRNNMSYYKRTLDNPKKLKALIEGVYGLRAKSPSDSKFFYRWAIALLIGGILLLSLPFLFVAGFVTIYGATIRPLTDKGLELRRYLLGLEKYIKASETERIAFLQGPDTVQKAGESVDVVNPGQILKLYERVLPYAVLFGQEAKWSKQLEQSYQATQASPDWYVGTTVFNAALFSSTLSSFSSAATYSGGSSSSTGGSSGGGSSGGGGGGGGGGGW